MRKGVKVYGIKIPMLLLLIAVSIALLSCDAARDLVPALPLSKQANAAIDSTCVSDVTGAAVFTQGGNSITLIIEMHNATPGLHAVHIHEYGDCSATGGVSAGGHWNPTNTAHRKWGECEFHLGDIGNIMVGDDGTGKTELTTDFGKSAPVPSETLSEKA